jgi:hypothetical protein
MLGNGQRSAVLIREIAAQYSAGVMTIWKIRAGKTWRHVD